MTVDATNEADLVNRLIAGDREAFETVYRRHNPSMIRVASAILRNHASAEEIAQEAWVAVLRNIGSFERRSSLASWIFTILTNKAKTRVVRDGRSMSLDANEGDDGLDDAFDGGGGWKDPPQLWDDITPERIVAGRKIMEHVSAAIDALPPAQRSVLVLRGQQGLKMSDVSKMLEITEGNARVLLHRARSALRLSLSRVLT